MTAPFTPAAVLDPLLTPVAWIDAQGRIVDCNTAFARWLGVGRKRLVDKPAAALEVEGEGLRHALDAMADAHSAPARLRRIALAFPGGAASFADAWVSRDGDGILLELHPVDEFPGDDPAKALPLALSAALKGLAHELRNPLAGLKGAAQLLRRRTSGDAGATELVELIGTEVDRLSHLLDQLLSPAPPQPHRPLNIHAVLEQVLRLAENDAGWAVRLVRDYDPSLPELSGDGDRLVQAVWNLVRNAIQAGATQVTLRTRAEFGVRIGEQLHPLALRMEIVDDGRGVPEEVAEQIFLPLVSGRADGTGLGLALAQQVAREHRGSLGYRSRPHHTVFTLLLPLLEPAAQEPIDIAEGAPDAR